MIIYLSSIESRISNIEYRIYEYMNIEYRTSTIEYRISNIEYTNIAFFVCFERLYRHATCGTPPKRQPMSVPIVYRFMIILGHGRGPFRGPSGPRPRPGPASQAGRPRPEPGGSKFIDFDHFWGYFLAAPRAALRLGWDTRPDLTARAWMWKT